MEGEVQVKKVVEGLSREMLEEEEVEVGLAALDFTANTFCLISPSSISIK